MESFGGDMNMPEDGVNVGNIGEVNFLDNQTALVESEVRQCLEDWIDAVNGGFADSIGALYTPSAILLPTFDSKVLSTAAERYSYFTNFKTRRGLRAYVDECHIEVLSDNSGVASGLYTFRFLGDDNSEQTVKARFTFVYARQEEGDWLIAAHHSSQTPKIG